MKTHTLLAAIGALCLSGAAHAKCYELADIDDFGPQTKFRYCDDSVSQIRLNVREMLAAPADMVAWGSSGPDAEIRFSEKTVTATPVEGWANDRATNAGLIIELADPAEAAKVAKAINAGETLDIVLIGEDGTEFTAFSGTFAMRFPDEMVQ